MRAWRAGEGASAGLELFDGAKRVRAAQALSWPTVRVEVHSLDAAGAKLRLLLCNETSGLSDLEVAWVVRSLYREDELDQPSIARLLGHDKSWVLRHQHQRTRTPRRDSSGRSTPPPRQGVPSNRECDTPPIVSSTPEAHA